MLLREPPRQSRELLTRKLQADLAIVGGGCAGVCAAITAARAGTKVVLIQDRPVLGGNGSSEVRLWVLGATAHMGCNNRWAREGGVIDELLTENMWRNKEGNAIIFDTILLEKVIEEKNITLLLNTSCYEVHKSGPDAIESVRAFCSQNSTAYEVQAPLFCDASGDGVVAFMAGAAFRMGAEAGDEFNEPLAPTKEFGELLGHTIYFYSKDIGRPVKFVPPSYALKDITRIPNYKSFNARDFGCKLWWIEYGGRLDTVHDTEQIKWELWKVVYGVWNHIKNSGEFPDAENLTLEWVGQIPGKREARRFEGDYILKQGDIIGQKHFEDAVAFGGWSIDLHPAEGVYRKEGVHGSNHWYSRGIYQIPYRSMYSRNIRNLFLAGRVISVSHVAHGTTRVIATLAQAAQAVGMAGAICAREKLLPADLSKGAKTRQLQRELFRVGQHIPGFKLEDEQDLARHAKITTSSQLKLAGLPDGGPLIPLDNPRGQMLPVPAGRMPRVSFIVNVSKPTVLKAELRTSDRADNYTPDVVLASSEVTLAAGESRTVTLDFKVSIDQARYVFVTLMKNADVMVHGSEKRVTGVLNTVNWWRQNYPKELAVESFDMFLPQRRPGGQNFAFSLSPALEGFGPENLTNGLARPTDRSNAWIADFADPLPTATLKWDRPRSIARIELSFDADFDHPMESSLMGHPENAMPFCVKRFVIRDAAGRVLADREQHLSRASVVLEKAVSTDRLSVELQGTHGNAPAALFEIRCYEQGDVD